MLADLLEKNVKTEKEPPVLNGALRIGDRGLELVQGPEKVLKRPPSRENDCDTEAKRPHINGDVSPEEPMEEGIKLCSFFSHYQFTLHSSNGPIPILDTSKSSILAVSTILYTCQSRVCYQHLEKT